MGKNIKFFDFSKVKVLIMDIDGVLTDGSVYVDEEGREFLKFSRIDGKGIELLKKRGVLVGVISSEKSFSAMKRIKKLNIRLSSFGTKSKLVVYKRWQKKFKFKDEEVIFCGDDIQDLPLIKQVGFSAAPSNALKGIKKQVDYVSKKRGGEGFVREVCDMIIKYKNEIS